MFPSIRYFGTGEKQPVALLHRLPIDLTDHHIYYKTDTSMLFPKVGKINVEKQAEKKLWIVPYDDETRPYIQHAFTTSHKNNMMCILMTGVEDEVSVGIRVNTDYFLLEGGMAEETYEKIYREQELEYFIPWTEFIKQCNTGRDYLIPFHSSSKMAGFSNSLYQSTMSGCSSKM